DRARAGLVPGLAVDHPGGGHRYRARRHAAERPCVAGAEPSYVRRDRRLHRADPRDRRRARLGATRHAQAPARDALVVNGRTVAVVVPAYDEEVLLPETLAGMPDFVDRIYVVDDASRDATAARARDSAASDPRIELLEHDRNRGVGAAIVSGYKRAIVDRIDVTAAMAPP